MHGEVRSKSRGVGIYFDASITPSQNSKKLKNANNMKKLQKLVLNKAKLMTSLQMKNILGGKPVSCIQNLYDGGAAFYHCSDVYYVSECEFMCEQEHGAACECWEA
jgi:hypothetical protein